MKTKLIYLVVLSLFCLESNAQLLGNFSGLDQDEWPFVYWYRDVQYGGTWDEGLIKHSSSHGIFGRPGFGIHLHESKDFTYFSTGWTPLLGIKGGSGETYIKGNVGIGVIGPSAKLEVGGTIKSHGASYFGGYDTGAAGSNSYSIEVGGLNPINNSGRATIFFHHHGVIANQLRYFGGNLYWEATSNGYGTTGTPNFLVGGSIGIGTENLGPHRLAVEGSIGAREVKVQAGPGWPDYVFEEGYTLTPLSELESYIRKNHHLPEVPSAQETAENGVEVSATLNLLLKKIEELTLYTIEQQKMIETQQVYLKNQNEELLTLKSKIENLESSKK